MSNFISDSDMLMQIRHLSKCIRKDFDNKLSSHGLTGVQGRVLFCINRCYEEGKEIRQSDLEDCFHLSKSSISELISRMIANDLVKKVKTKSGNSLIPSEKGKSIVNEIHDGKKEVIEKLFTGFSKEETDLMNEFVQRMTENIEKEEDIVCGKK